MKHLVAAVFALLAALLLGFVVLWILHVPPLDACKGMLALCWARKMDTAAKALVLCLLGTGISVAFRAGFWNVGAEGQLCVGAIAAAGIGLYVAPASLWPAPWLWTALALVAGTLAGAFWCLGPALVRAKWQVSEVVTTLMLVYVAKRLLEYLYLGPWRDPQGYGFPGSAPLSASLHVSLVWIAILTGVGAIICALLVKKTVIGFEMSVLSESRDVARYGGIHVGRCLAIVGMISGGLAGLAGAVQVTGTAGRLISGISVGDGFTAIIIACLAGRHPLGVLIVAPFWAMLKVGAEDLEVSYQIPQAFSTALEGICLLCWLTSVWIGRRWFRRFRGNLT